MNENHPPFEHAPLDEPLQIRLVKVYAKTSIDHQVREAVDPREAIQNPIWCQFKTVSLDNLSHSYNAISYSCGDPKKTGKVLCGANRYIGLTSSAMLLLHAIAATNVPSYLWIDALCIGQSNHGEKSRQTRLTQDIFASAKKVIACLGKLTPETGEAIDFIVTPHNAIKRIYRSGQPVTRQSITQGPCEYPSSRWTALSKFLKNPHFQCACIV